MCNVNIDIRVGETNRDINKANINIDIRVGGTHGDINKANMIINEEQKIASSILKRLYG